MKRFEKEDILRNTMKTHPKVRFLCYNGKIYYNNSTEEDLFLNKFLLLQKESISIGAEGAILTELGEAILTEDGDYLVIEQE